MRYLNWSGYIAIPLAFLVHFWLGREGEGEHKSWEPTVTEAWYHPRANERRLPTSGPP